MRKFKRVMASVMAAALALSLAGTATEADAAKKIKFAKKSVTVNVKKTKTVKIKNVKAKKVKKLAVKSANKKVATVSKKGKTAVKVKGVKAGKTKVTATLTIKGQKKKTKLTLKVTVKKVTPPVVTPAPTAAVSATPAVSAPAATAPGASAPAVTEPAASEPAATAPGASAPATDKPTSPPKATWTPDPDKVKTIEDFTVKYGENGAGFEFAGPRVVKFDGTVVNHDNEEDADNYENAKADGYPKDGVDVRYYKQIIAYYEGIKLTGDGDWFGKATLSSTDEGLGCNEYADGLFLRYLNDVDTDGGYKDGVYTVVYDIDESKMTEGYEFNDIEFLDAISVQLANQDDYAGFKLKQIDFIAPEKVVDPNETPDPNAPTVTIKLGRANIAEGETTSVEVVAPEGVEVTNEKWSVEDSNIAEVNGNVVTAKAVGETKIKLEAVAKSGGKDYNVAPEVKLTVKEKGAVIVNLENAPAELAYTETAMIAVAVDTGTIEKVEWKVEGDALTVNGDNTKALITAVKAGQATVTATVTVNSGDKTAVEEASATINVTSKTYAINEELELDASADGNTWTEILLDKMIKIKKTDTVEVVFSVKSGSEDSMAANSDAKVRVSLSTMEDDTPYKKNESAVLRTEASVAGKATFANQETYFTNNYAEIKYLVAQNTTKLDNEKVAVVIEKIIVTPTNKVALSVHAPTTIEVGKTVTIDVEVDDGYTLDWKSSDATKATVNNKGEVTGVAESDAVTITIDVMKDGKKVEGAGASVTMAVADSYKDKAIPLDLSTATLYMGEGEIKQTKDGSKVTAIEISGAAGVTLDLPHKVANGETVKVTVEGTIAESGTGFRLYLVPASGDITGGSNIFGAYNDKGAIKISDVELTASREDPALCFRIPDFSHKVDGVTITKVTVEYAS